MDDELKPDDLRALANTATVDPAWVARAQAALIAAADAWESSNGALLDDLDYVTYCRD